MEKPSVGLNLAQDKIIINCRYDDRFAVKRAGARWDRRIKKWWIPATPWYINSLLENVEPALVDGDLAPLLKRAAAEQAIAESGKCPASQVGHLVSVESWAHQRAGVDWILAHRASVLYWGMGTGKSRTAIEAILAMDAGRVLIVCPSPVIGTLPDGDDPGTGWGKQFGLYGRGITPLLLGKGSSAQRAKKIAATKAKVIVINYESFWRNPVDQAIEQFDPQVVIYDECHRLKAPGGKASKSAYYLTGCVPGRKVIGLTGTPMPNSPLDVYGIFRALDPGIFGTNFASFRQQYAVMGGPEKQFVVDYQNIDELHEKFYRIAHHVKDDVIDLPPLVISEYPFSLSSSNRAAYEEMRTTLMLEVEAGAITAANAGVKTMKLRQIVSGFVYSGEDRDRQIVRLGEDRYKALIELLSDIPKSEPLVIFCVFKPEIQDIARACAETGRTFSVLGDGQHQHTAWINGETDVLIGQVQAASEGIELQRACINIYYSTDWSLGTYKQSLKRSHRAGQTRSVRAIHLVANGTVDRAVVRALERKEDVVNAVLHHFGADEKRAAKATHNPLPME